MRAVKALVLTIAASLLLAVCGCGGGSSSSGSTESEASAPKSKPKVQVPKGPPPKQLEVKEIVQGTGTEAQAGDEVTVQYVGVNYKSGKEFDSSWSRNEPFTFTLGAGEVIQGWDQGVAGMKEGGRRELIIPPNLGYGPSGSPPVIPPNETLVFVIDLLTVE